MSDKPLTALGVLALKGVIFSSNPLLFGGGYAAYKLGPKLLKAATSKQACNAYGKCGKAVLKQTCKAASFLTKKGFQLGKKGVVGAYNYLNNKDYSSIKENLANIKNKAFSYASTEVTDAELNNHSTNEVEDNLNLHFAPTTKIEDVKALNLSSFIENEPSYDELENLFNQSMKSERDRHIDHEVDINNNDGLIDEFSIDDEFSIAFTKNLETGKLTKYTVFNGNYSAPIESSLQELAQLKSDYSNYSSYGNQLETLENECFKDDKELELK